MTIQVVGLGLIGGSLCKTIKKRTSHRVLGMDRDPAAVEKARAAGAIDGEGSPDTLEEADLTMVCLYPEGTISFLLDNRDRFRKGSIVMDVCGVKGAVVSAAAGPLKEAGVRFVGCHPMAGREFSGFDYAKDDLFDGASFILTPTRETDPAAVETLRALALDLGFGKAVVSTPEDHDRIIAATSQLAHVASNAYIKSPTLRHQAGFSAGSYLDLTRVAKLSEDMWTSLFLLNRDALLYEVDTLIVVKKTDPAEIREGDVISFYSLDPALDGAVNTHRVVSVEKEGDGYIYQTKGDANNVADAYDVQSEYLVGKVIWSSLILGKISRLAANPLIFIPVILLPLSVILLTNLIHTVRLAKKITREEEEAAVREAVEELRKRKNQEKPLE